MSYYKLLGLQREPFSTNPDPEFFYRTRGHTAAFYRLRAAVDLRRGLNLILGDVGTGKSTLMRKLTTTLADEPEYLVKVILDPSADSEQEFLLMLSGIFGLHPRWPSVSGCRKIIEHFLFEEGLVHGRTVVLFIDEAQKLSAPSMEALRVLLNYETNEMKLIQIVLLGQMELLTAVSRIKNLWDRIAFKYVINPLEKDETRELIHFRLKRAGSALEDALFDEESIEMIHRCTQGYPRRVTMICHDALEYLVMYDKRRVDRDVIETLMRQEVKPTVLVPG